MTPFHAVARAVAAGLAAYSLFVAYVYAAMPEIRSDSFTRSSAASRTRVVPLARAAATASTGISSISRGTSGPAISVAATAPDDTVTVIRFSQIKS